MSSRFRLVGACALFSSFTLLNGCASSTKVKSDDDKPTTAASKENISGAVVNEVPRRDFNRIAAELALPLFWTADKNGDGKLNPDTELAVLWDAKSSTTNAKKHRDLFADHYQSIAAIHTQGHDFKGLTDDEKTRRQSVLLELSQGRPTLVENDFSGLSDEDKSIVKHIMGAATLVEELHALQLGVKELEAGVSDSMSKSLFFRNQGPWCQSPKTEKDPACGALAVMPGKKQSGLYPKDVQGDGFCEQLAKDNPALAGHFSTVQKDASGKLIAVPYPQAYASQMAGVATHLDAAAAAITSADEQGFKTYLTAAANGFRTNDWEPANAAWAAQGQTPSKWYLRIGPDEVYFEPCAFKAGFHVSFARINPASITWQQKLDPVKAEMEQALAAMAGAPYKARDVKFQLPDFIDIVLNAGDSRSAQGATIGQSLPNWGETAAKGGRTVVMTNLYTDPDSKQARQLQMSSIFCKETLAAFNPQDDNVLGTVLHEAAHNLGPAHEYAVDGKTAPQIFGGPLASTLEELKAQTSALYFTNWLADKKLLDDKDAKSAHVGNLAWTFGHISRGMYTATKQPRNYSQLAAIQVGFFIEKGGMVWHDDQMAGADKGCMEIDFAKLRTAIDELQTRVLRIKGGGDKADAEALKKLYVDDDSDFKKLRAVIAERWLRTEKASFVYSIKL
ncbi:MAG: hypothetical protein GY822_24650 [Deltaproteobacteria bacterium]|nr:hypothetical protein [Deltaproteobacteria bacterium]